VGKEVDVDVLITDDRFIMPPELSEEQVDRKKVKENRAKLKPFTHGTTALKSSDSQMSCSLAKILQSRLLECIPRV
jgi:tRNA G10  N-methylase Trm11